MISIEHVLVFLRQTILHLNKVSHRP